MNNNMVNYNLNGGIGLKLTDAGIQRILHKEYLLNTLYKEITVKEYRDKADINGYHYITMWKFLYYFGGDNYLYPNYYFDMNVFLDDKLIKK